MRAAGIDLGTNSALLLVAQVEGRRIIPLLEEEKEIRIGEGLGRGKDLTQSAMERALRALSEFKEKALSCGVERLRLVGTNALREAANREEFLGLVKDRLGLELSVLSPAEEAELSFRGAVYGLESPGSPVFIADIGGGSTELVRGDGGQIVEWQSLPLGGVGLTERYVHSDPISREDLRRLNTGILQVLQTIRFDLPPTGVLVGVGGTITTLAAMDMGMACYDPQPVHGYWLSLSSVESIFNRLKSSPLLQRREMVGLSPKRAEIILAGTAICLHLMNYFSRSEVLVSSRGLRWGLVLKELARDPPSPSTRL